MKIYLLKDQDDYQKTLTEDDIVNITGEKGSGKSYDASRLEDDNHLVVHLDSIFLEEGNEYHKTSNEVKEYLLNKYHELDISLLEKEYYQDIINFIKEKNKKGIIEGITLTDINDISILKGKVIVKRTGVLKSFLRTIKRDYHNKYFMDQETEKHGKMKGKARRLLKVVERRKKILKEYHQVEDFMNLLNQEEGTQDKNKIKKLS